MGLLDPRQWLLVALLCAAAALGVHVWSTRLVEKGDAAGYARATAEATAAALKATNEAKQRESALQADADTERREKSHEINRLRSEHAAAIERLRHRPERPTTTTGHLPAPAVPGATAAGCTGAELYRQDGQVLRGESLRAEQIRIELKACYAQYERARKMINEWADEPNAAPTHRP